MVYLCKLAYGWCVRTITIHHVKSRALIQSSFPAYYKFFPVAKHPVSACNDPIMTKTSVLRRHDGVGDAYLIDWLWTLG